jgi:hypothetical protein
VVIGEPPAVSTAFEIANQSGNFAIVDALGDNSVAL